MRYIVCLHAATNDYAVYVSGARGPYGTPLVFRGTLEDCLAHRA